MVSYIDLHKFADVIFGITQKPHYMLYIANKQIFLNLFCNLKRDWKEGGKLQTFEYLENEKSFLDEAKNIFNSF